MARGEYSAGEAARLFLLRRLQAGPVAVEQLEAEARREGIARRTLFRMRRRLGLVNRRAWALPAEQSAPQQATVEREEPVRNRTPVPDGTPVGFPTPVENSTPGQNLPPETESGVVAAVAETDPRVQRVVAEVTNLIAGGLGREIAIHRVCRGDRELEAQVLKELSH